LEKKHLRSDTTGVGGTIKYRPFLNMSWSGLLDTMGAWGVSWCRLMSIAIANDIIGRPGRVHSRDYENVIQECKNARIWECEKCENMRMREYANARIWECEKTITCHLHFVFVKLYVRQGSIISYLHILFRHAIGCGVCTTASGFFTTAITSATIYINYML
jgi:hypothetical protein